VAGADKQAAMQRIVDGEDLPAARVQADRILWLVDRDAAPSTQPAPTMVSGTAPA